MDILMMVQIFNTASIEMKKMYDKFSYEYQVKELKGGIMNGQKNECCIR